MLSLEQIKSVTFDRIVRGYRPEDVDDFIAQVAQQLEKLMEENKELENKLYILADSVEGYRSDEEALKAALINAQRLGESVIREANQKAEHILKEAKIKSDRDFDIAMEKVHAEQMHLARMQQEVARFRGDVIDAYKQHITLLSNLPIDDKTEAIPVNYFDNADKEFSDRQYADRQAAKPTATAVEAAEFEPPVIDPLSVSSTPQQENTEQQAAQPQPQPQEQPPVTPQPIEAVKHQTVTIPPISTGVFDAVASDSIFEPYTEPAAPVAPQPTFEAPQSDSYLSTEGFEQAFLPRDMNMTLTEEEKRMALAKKNAANATSEFSPIIPLMSVEEEPKQEPQQPQATQQPQQQQQTPTGRVSLFDHYSEFKLD